MEYSGGNLTAQKVITGGIRLMKTVVELDAKDIQEIVAKHFNVAIEAVKVSNKTVCRGFGMSEHIEAVPVVKIIKEES